MTNTRFPILLSMLFVLGAPCLAQPEEEMDIKERLKFQQKRTLQQMEELEDRMFQLSEKIRQVAPDNAARLVLALQRSREELIVEEMGHVNKLIESEKLKEAEELQRRVIFRLKELRELLLSTELDLLLKLKRLRQMNKALRAMEDLSKEQEGLKEETEEAAEDPTTNRDSLKNTRRAQSEARKRGELLAEDVAEAAPESVAPDLMNSAHQDMKESEKQLAKGRAKEAAEAQASAAKNMKESRKALQRAREDLLRELQKYIRNALVDAFLQAIEIQEKINGQLQVYLKRAGGAEGRKIRPRDFSRFEDQEIEIESRLRDAVQLIEETEYSLALAPATRFFGEYATELRESMKRAKLEQGLLDTGTRLVEDLAGAVKILAEEARWSKKAPPDDHEAFRQIKLITELLTLRLVQDRIRTDTGRLQGLPIENSTVAANVKRIARWESSIKDVSHRLEARGYSQYLKPEDETDF